MMEESILWITTVVDQKAVLTKREQKRRERAQKLGILIVCDTTDMRLNSQTASNILLEEHVGNNTSDLKHEEEFCFKKKLKNKGSVDREDFLKAVTNGNLNVVTKYLEDGFDPNTCDKFRKSALHRAAFEGHVKIVERLLDKGADINFQDQLAGTPVHWACRGGSLATLKVLQSRGAELNVKDKLLSTPLHVAARTGHSDIVDHLIASGIQINARDREGDTALHDAVRLNRFKIVKLLILAGANMKIRNAEGVTATEQVKLWQFDTKETLDKFK